MSTTMDNVTTDTEMDPEALALVEMIDAALRECASRSLVSADEMADMLLDIRAAACSLAGE